MRRAIASASLVICVAFAWSALAEAAGTEPVTVALTSDINPSVWNQTVTFSATVDPPAATGTITFKDSLFTFGVVPLSGGVAMVAKSNLNPGRHTALKAIYSGDATYQAGTSPAYSQLVYRAGSSISLTTDIDPSTCLQTIRVMAGVSPQGATNRVAFYDGGNPIGTASVNSQTGQATLFVGNLLSGKHELTAQYQGDTHYEPSSTTGPYSQVVNARATSTALTSDANPSTCDASVTLTAAVTPDDVGGFVVFLDGATSLGMAWVSDGIAALVAPPLTVGDHPLTAVYVGDDCSATSTSPVDVQSVLPPAPADVAVGFPNGGEILFGAAEVDLAWTATGDVSTVDLSISIDNGATYAPIATAIPNTGTYHWTVPYDLATFGDDCHPDPVYSALLQVQARVACGVTGEDVSDAPFAIYYPAEHSDPPPYATIDGVTLTEGNSGATTVLLHVTKDGYPHLSLSYTTADGTATAADGDYVPTSGTLSFGIYPGSATIAVVVNGDDHLEPTEMFRVVLTKITCYGNVYGPATVTIADDDSTRLAVEPAAPAIASLAVTPTPARERARVEFGVAHAAHVRIGVIDVEGRRVASLTDGVYAQGRYAVTWNGVTERGRAPAGLYFVRYETSGQRLIQRLVLAR